MRYRPAMVAPLSLLRTSSLAATLTSAALIGCGSSAQPAATTTASNETTTSGGETETTPQVTYDTTPVPVPQTAVPRAQLAQAVQDEWLEVERGIAERPPLPPADSTETSLTEWYGGPYRDWIMSRIASANRANDAINQADVLALHERGVGAGLMGYFYEQTAAEARSAPIPPAIQGDAELLDIYRSSLDGVLAPLALRSVEAYRFCVAAFDEMSEADGANAPAWGEWRAWCEDRGVEVLTLYGPPTGPHGEEQTTGSAQ